MAKATIYSDDIASLICSRIAEGESLRSICEDDDMPGGDPGYPDDGPDGDPGDNSDPDANGGPDLGPLADEDDHGDGG